jgi:hypothetical protein
MRLLGTDDDPRVKQLEQVVHSIWAEGIVLGVNKKALVTISLMSLVLTPVGLLISVIKRFIPLGVLAVIYIFFHEKANAHYPYLLELLISLTAFAVLRKEIQKEVIDICLTVISLVSFGSFLQWLGRGYKRNTVLFNRFFSSEAAKGLVAQYLPYCHS